MTLLIPSGPAEAKHLFVILTNADKYGQLLLVSISTIRTGKNYDATTIVVPGEHEFIKAPSFVYYRKIEQRPRTGLIKCVENGLFSTKEPTTDRLFNRICSGLPQSEMSAPWAIKYFAENSKN